MKRKLTFLLLALLAVTVVGVNWLISDDAKTERERRNMVDTRVDNNGYYKRLAEKGLYVLNPEVRVQPAVFTGSKIKAFSVLTDDSPDVPVTTINSTQSENSVFINPLDPDNVLNSNNSTQNPVGSLYGANDLYSFDASETWQGKVQGAAGSNSGDPAVAMGWNGRWYINYISNPGGQGVAYSDNQGETWTAKTIAPNPGQLADKNHFWIDNSLTSPYEGNLYNAWTDFGGPHDLEIVISNSSDDGDTWTTRQNISAAINAGSHNQGVNIQTGPNGEVYAAWAVYDGWPTDETAIGFAKSLDGGTTWSTASRIISNIRGIRTSETGKNMRVNSFPVMTVDISGGSNNGTIYLVWSNIGVPGVNTDVSIDVYMIKSTNQGATWSTPIRVNQDEFGQGKQHYFPWITCDPENGILSVIFYDDRNVSSTQCEVYCANSDDGGETWEDFKVSDVAFTPAPIPGLAGGYMGDYLGIAARGGKVYPVWADNRSGVIMSYCSPYETNPLNRPSNLVAVIEFESGQTTLDWTFETAPGFLNFNIYRDNVLIGTSATNNFIDQLPDYGYYAYKVTAFYEGELESGASSTNVQWGDAQISMTPVEIYQYLMPDSTAQQMVLITNTGQLDMNFAIGSEIILDRQVEEYCAGSGGGDEYISQVSFGSIENTTGSNGYGDYTALSEIVMPGQPIDVVIQNGNPYSGDQVGVWVDWNQDEVFNDEEITVAGSPGMGPYTATIIPPMSALPGLTRMRVRLTYTGSVDPCGTTQYGEVEDYSLYVVSWLSYGPTSGSVAPGQTDTIFVNFNATDLEIGHYFANLFINSNDPDNGELTIPVHLRVNNLQVVAVADTNAVCSGNGVQLSAEASGGSGTYTYYWQNGAGETISNDQVSMIYPTLTDTYVVFASDGEDTLSGNAISINVFDLPTVDLGLDTLLCGGDNWSLDAGNPGATYLWSNGATAQSIVVDTLGLGYGVHEFWVAVTNETNCISYDTVRIEFLDCTNIDEQRQMKASVYPNPGKGLFNLQLTNLVDQPLKLRAINSGGTEVFSARVQVSGGQLKHQIDLTNQPSGTYTLIIEGQTRMIKKLIIQ
ncbi:MAG: GEVED domain-containing protein [Bacteroidales bacterium]|nr:GEVED domain-containing protein [Bacteroidales bacterium]